MEAPVREDASGVLLAGAFLRTFGTMPSIAALQRLFFFA